MDAVKNEATPDRTYKVVAVEKTEPPAGIEGGDWYRYVIARENETIVGNRRGTLKEVTQHANECAQNLSYRVAGGTPYWSSSARKKK
ncbi:MAG: hypothetical protein PVH46_02350 [Granulosicoccaceae bacterium]|jgi:hypothetical protein